MWGIKAAGGIGRLWGRRMMKKIRNLVRRSIVKIIFEGFCVEMPKK